MKKARPILSPSLITVLVLLTPMAPVKADAPFDHFVEFERIEIDETFEFENPCTGQPALGTIQGQAHLLQVFDGAGGEYVDLLLVVHGKADDAAGNTYAVAQTISAVGASQLDERNLVITAEVNVLFVSSGKGENYVAHGLTHITMTPSGNTTEFEIISTECRG